MGKADGEGGAQAGPCTGDRKRATVQFDKVFGDIQSQPQPVRIGMLLQGEGTKYARQIDRLDALAGVRYIDPYAAFFLHDLDLDGAAHGRKLDSVKQEIPEYLLQALGVGIDRDLPPQNRPA